MELTGALKSADSSGFLQMLFTLFYFFYRSPVGEINIFLSTVYKILNKFYNHNFNFLICGDFNLDC
ncbi:hypothetical protein C0J52_06079 [Blattella germanica]|nr:hypothetical protein C0J52_06079 [Blattella germanica]